MDGATLAAAMGNSLPQATYDAYTPTFNAALIAAHCTTVNRVAMFCAQVGEESYGLKWMQELASGSEYNGRRDLGNTSPGDGPRYKGRGPLQLTGKFNYGHFSQWCYDQRMVPTATYFVDNPTLLMDPQWGFLSASWYWTVARAALNSYADAGNIVAATMAINGGTNGLADRRARWQHCLSLGNRLLPDDPSGDDELDANQAKMLQDVHDQLTALLTPWGGGVSDKEGGSGYNLFQYVLRNNVEAHQALILAKQLNVQVSTLQNQLSALLVAQANQAK